MAFQFGESPNSRTGNAKPPTQLRKYFAIGTTDEQYVMAYAAAAIPTAIVTNQGVLYRQDIVIDSWKGPHCELSAPYAKIQRETGSLRWSFDTTGGTVNVKAAKSHVASYPEGAASHAGALNVNKDGAAEGTEIVIPAQKFTVVYSHPLGILTLDRAFALGDATGSSNDDVFFTKPAGSFLFLGATGSDGTDADAEVTYQFAYSRNLTDEIVAGITVAAKAGWDYAWVEFKPDTDANQPVQVAKAVHVDRVYPRLSFTSVLGFG